VARVVVAATGRHRILAFNSGFCNGPCGVNPS
jgi:hypothetical protein